MADRPADLAVVGGRLLTGLLDVTSDLGALDASGTWAVVLPFEGDPVCARFASVRPARPWPGAPWRGPRRDAWTPSPAADGLGKGGGATPGAIPAGAGARGNLGRGLQAPLPPAPG